MAALVAADLVLSNVEVRLLGRKRRITGKLTFGDGAKTYSTGGIPLPSVSTFGFYRQMDNLDIYGVNGLATDYLPTVTQDLTKLQLWCSHDTAGATKLPMDEAAATEAPAARSYNFEAWGW